MSRITVIGNGRPATIDPKEAVANLDPEVRALVETNMADATAERQVMALVAVALRAQGHPWSVVGQGSGFGNSGVRKSGAGAARTIVAEALKATRPEHAPGTRGTSAAQAAMPLAGPATDTRGSAQHASRCSATTKAGNPCKGRPGPSGTCPVHTEVA